MATQCRMTWPDGRKFLLSKKTLESWKQWYRGALVLPWPDYQAKYEALLAAEEVEVEEEGVIESELLPPPLED